MSRKGNHSDDEDDETFYYRYSSIPAVQPPPSTTTNPSHGASGSGGLAPSKSTVYVSNIDYNLTNSDLFTIFSTFGKVAKVTVLKDRLTRQSRGVAFILFVTRDDAVKAAKGMDKKILNGRTLRASIATDNGRATEFIRKKVYKDKSRCYECGEEGHLSYECPKNFLGSRERPPTKKGRRRDEGEYRGKTYESRFDKKMAEQEEDEEDEGNEVFETENWASVVDGGGAEERLIMGDGGREVIKKEKKANRKLDVQVEARSSKDRS